MVGGGERVRQTDSEASSIDDKTDEDSETVVGDGIDKENGPTDDGKDTDEERDQKDFFAEREVGPEGERHDNGDGEKGPRENANKSFGLLDIEDEAAIELAVKTEVIT